MWPFTFDAGQSSACLHRRLMSSGTVRDAISESTQSAIHMRERLREAVPIVEFMIKGVSFEGRQESVKSLTKSMPQTPLPDICLCYPARVDYICTTRVDIKHILIYIVFCLAGEAIMLLPEPENEFDSHAIAIKKLDGQMLGYVPREMNQMHEFLHGVLFGHVEDSGQASGDQPGFTWC